jgi:stage V sporulation protein B
MDNVYKEMHQDMNIFFRGVLLLAAAALVGESLELIINMILARQLGELGLGHYMSIFPTVILIIIIASLELPISISKFVAEKEEKQHYSMLKHATKLTLLLTAAMIIIAIFVLPFIPVFNSYHPLVRWLMVLLIPLISLTSIARGFFMGKQQMGKLAFSNLFRKLAQLILLVGIYQLFSFDRETAILVALATFVGSELVVFVYLFTAYLLQYRKMKTHSNEFLSAGEVTKSLMAVTIPTTGLRLFHAVTNAVQPFLIKYSLSLTGISDVAATEQFGLLAGVAISIGFFPAFIAHSLLVVLIPTVSEATAKKDVDKLKMLLMKVMSINDYVFSLFISCSLFGIIMAELFVYVLFNPSSGVFDWIRINNDSVYSIRLVYDCFIFSYVRARFAAILRNARNHYWNECWFRSVDAASLFFCMQSHWHHNMVKYQKQFSGLKKASVRGMFPFTDAFLSYFQL